MYRLLASDIDDTLLPHGGIIPEDSRKALRLLHEHGVAVVFATGRATVSMKKVVSRIIEPADDEYLISFNGGRVVTALSEQVVYEEVLPSPLIAEIMGYARQFSLHVQGYDEKGFLVEKGQGARIDADDYAEISGLPFREVDDLARALPGGSVKLLIIGEPEELKRHQQALQAMAGGRFTAMFSKPRFLEIVGSGVSKGRALSMLAERLGIPLSQCIAMGDSTNDIDMLETAGLGVAVANARDEVKQAADAVLDRGVENGAVIELLERYFPEIAAKL